MIGAHDKSDACKCQGDIFYEVSVEAHLFFFAGDQRNDENDGIGVEESAFYPAELAGIEMGELGIE